MRPERRKDALTGTLDHVEFAGVYDEEVARVGEKGESISVALADVDDFARINAQHGRETGDAVLKAVAGHLKEAFPEGCVVFRCGGDEFAVLLPGVEREDALLLAEKVRRSFAMPPLSGVGGQKDAPRVALSIGLSSYPEDGCRSDDVLRRADEALHRAKAGGKNRVCLSRQERMVTKTSHYTVRQLERLAELARREGLGEAALLREALDELLRKYEERRLG